MSGKRNMLSFGMAAYAGGEPKSFPGETARLTACPPNRNLSNIRWILVEEKCKRMLG
jgi:hypothetical protein